jgi:cysteine desulfurase/selenocysteine lyase
MQALDVATIRKDFPIFERMIGGHPIHFLDSGASSQKPSRVIDAMGEFARHHYANVHRGAYTLSLEATMEFERCRNAVARFIGASTPNEVVLTRGATTALNQVAAGWAGEHLGQGDTILLTTFEHHANLIPWQMVARRTGAALDFVPFTEDYLFDSEAFERKLNSDVKVVAVTGMSNVLGTLPPLADIVERAHEAGAIVVVDGAQLVPHFGIDVQGLGADFVAVSAHKMLGPTGIGFLWGRMERLEEMEPFEGGGEMIADVQLESATWAAIPHRFEAGTPAIIESVGLTAAIEYLETIGMEAVAAHDAELTSYALGRLADIPSLTVYGPTDLSKRGGVISFTLGDAHPHDLATILDSEGVSVRAGHHCAKPLIKELGVPATARASFYVYNTTDDVNALIDGLAVAADIFSPSRAT